MLNNNDPEAIQTASLMAIGELLDELICLQQGHSVDERHQNFEQKLRHNLEWIAKHLTKPQGRP
jgi:hypothetical protein